MYQILIQAWDRMWGKDSWVTLRWSKARRVRMEKMSRRRSHRWLRRWVIRWVSSTLRILIEYHPFRHLIDRFPWGIHLHIAWQLISRPCWIKKKACCRGMEQWSVISVFSMFKNESDTSRLSRRARVTQVMIEVRNMYWMTLIWMTELALWNKLRTLEGVSSRMYSLLPHLEVGKLVSLNYITSPLRLMNLI